MQKYKLEINIDTATLLGSGEGFGYIIDSDLIFDNYGLPYLPGRRLKGLLRESALEIIEMAKQANIFSDIPQNTLQHIFGSEGQMESGEATINNLYLEDYQEVREWLKWAYAKHGNVISPSKVLDVYTELRHQTSIKEDGIARNGSLRISRVLKAGNVFKGNIVLNRADDKKEKLLALACSNLRHLGSKRNRGLGEVQCILWKEKINLTKNYLEDDILVKDKRGDNINA